MEEGLRANWIELLHRLAPLLPADLFDRLRGFASATDLSADAERSFADDLEQAIAALDSLHHTLTTFLPRYLLDLSPTPGRPQGELLEGSFVFADVTGFTALTGELSKRGTAGREEMNRLMRTLFATLLEPLLASGGDLLIFAGDAALAFFPAQPDGEDACRATRTALRLVQAIAPFAHLETPYGAFSLTMSAGVERGRAFAAAVGTRQRMELLISGGPVQGAMKAEGKGEPREVVAGPGSLTFLDPDEFVLRDDVVEGVRGELDSYEAQPPARRRERLAAIFSRRVPDLIEHLQITLGHAERLAPFIPPDLFTQIARGEDIRQHPPVAVQFINVVGVEELALGPVGPEHATAALQRYFVQAQEIVADREGIVSQVDPYAKGFTLLNPFGAPTHHEGVPRLAASSALELARLLERVNQEFDLDPPLVQRAGLTYDRIFTGEIGYRHRREYVIAGPAVNLAARLMSKSDFGQIVLDPAIWKEIEGDFLAEPLAPIPLKGIPEPVPRFSLLGLNRGKSLRLTEHPLVNRQAEQTDLERRLEETIAGRGGAVAVVGEAGIGKSHLVATLAETASRKGVTVLTGRCHPFTQTTPYFPWADLVSRWCEVGEEVNPEIRRQRLSAQLARFELAPSFPALADLLELPPAHLAPREEIPERRGPGLFAAIQQKAEQGQADSQGLAALLSRRVDQAEKTERQRPSVWDVVRHRVSISEALPLLLERQAQEEPTLVILEDLQWMDPESHKILEAVGAAASARPLLLLVTTRPENDWAGENLSVPPLAETDSRTLAALTLRATSLELDLAAWLSNRAGGNPLFITSYCRALRDADAVVVDPASGEARWSGPPPPLSLSLQELLLAQVDRLGQDVREVLRRGAVIGTSFPFWLLVQLYRDEPSSDQLEQALYRAARRSLIDPPPPAQGYTFTSQSLHDAVYATLSHALRRTWHEQVGNYLVQDELARYRRLEQIAYHYSRCGDPYKAALFTRLAGDKARTRQADEAALTFYEQTLAVEGGAEIAAEQQLAREGTGDTQALRGEVADAYISYRAALETASPEAAPHLNAKLALLVPLASSTDPEPLEAAYEALPSTTPLRPWLLAALVWLYAERSDAALAITLCQDLLPTAGEPVATLLREALGKLEEEKPLPPYTDFFALFTHSCLRLPAQNEP